MYTGERSGAESNATSAAIRADHLSLDGRPPPVNGSGDLRAASQLEFQIQLLPPRATEFLPGERDRRGPGTSVPAWHLWTQRWCAAAPHVVQRDRWPRLWHVQRRVRCCVEMEWNTTRSTPVVKRSYILRRSAMEGGDVRHTGSVTIVRNSFTHVQSASQQKP